MASQDASKRKICGNLENSGVCLILRYIQRSQNPGGSVRRSLNRADSEKELRASLLLTSLCLTAAAHASSNAHTHTHTHTHNVTGISGPRPIRGGVRPSLSLIGLDHDMRLTCLLSNSRETFWVADTFIFFANGWAHQCDQSFFLVAPLRN